MQVSKKLLKLSFCIKYAQEKLGTAENVTELPQEYKDLEKVKFKYPTIRYFCLTIFT